MKHKRLILLVSIMTVVYILTNIGMVLGASVNIESRSPGSGRLVDTMVVPLKVTITSGGEPVPNAYVHFYVDDKWISGAVLTNKEGFAGKGVSGIQSFGRHNWYVKVDKHGTTLAKSSKWTFNYQPKPVLTIHSDYGEVYGDGKYAYNATAVFGLEPTIIDINESVRVVFVEWMGVHKEAYSGPEVETSVNMTDDITEYAIWKTQYYVNMSCEVPPAVRPDSGWYDEGDLIGISVESLPGTEFLYWVGSGNESYSGTDMSKAIRIYSPIDQEAFFEREEYQLDINSEYSNTYGSGMYPAWENVSFGLESGDVYLSEGERVHFTGWDSDSSYGYEGNSTEHYIHLAEDMTQEANWAKQYLVNVSSTEGGNVSTTSGWMEENSELVLATTGEQDFKFVGWIGEGEGSYSGLEKNHTIVVKGPITEKADWRQMFYVYVNSSLPVEGEGQYLDGETVVLRAKPNDGTLVRRVFKEWTGDLSSTSNPIDFTIRKDMDITAVYSKDYLYLLIAMVALFVLLGIIVFKIFA